MTLQLDWISEGRYSPTMPTHPEPRPERLARRHDSETSKRAAEKAVDFKAGHEAKVFGAIFDAGERGACAKEIARRTGLTDVQVNRRLGDMGERGLIERKLRKDPVSDHDYERREGCAVWWRA